MDDDTFNNHVSNLYWTSAKENNTHNDRHLKVGKKNGKAIRRIEDGKIFESMSEAAREIGVSVARISQVCKNKNETAGGYHFEFVNEEYSANCGTKKPVYDMDTGITYKSMSAAARALGVSNQTVIGCLKGDQKTAGGHRIVYADKVKKVIE